MTRFISMVKHHFAPGSPAECMLTEARLCLSTGAIFNSSVDQEPEGGKWCGVKFYINRRLGEYGSGKPSDEHTQSLNGIEIKTEIILYSRGKREHLSLVHVLHFLFSCRRMFSFIYPSIWTEHECILTMINCLKSVLDRCTVNALPIPQGRHPS